MDHFQQMTFKRFARIVLLAPAIGVFCPSLSDANLRSAPKKTPMEPGSCGMC